MALPSYVASNRNTGTPASTSRDASKNRNINNNIESGMTMTSIMDACKGNATTKHASDSSEASRTATEAP
jgi:hypothetical protein